MKKRYRRMEVFYTEPCALPPIFAREKGNVDRKTLVGAALARCICKDISHDEWHLKYESGKYGRGVRSEFEKALVKIQRLYHGFGKEIVIIINNVILCDSRRFDDSVVLPSFNLFDESSFKSRREKGNELSNLFRTWFASDLDTKMGISIPQLGIVSDIVMRGNFGVQALELMRYKSGVRGSWGLARLRSYGALASILEVARFGLTNGGGIVLGHFGNPQVEKLVEDIQDAFKRVTETSYTVRDASLSYWIAMIHLTNNTLRIRKMPSDRWEYLPLNLESFRGFLERR